MPLLLALLVLILLFAIAFTLAENWGKMRTRLVITGTVLFTLALGIPFAIGYSLATYTGCVPNCVGASLVGRNFNGFELNDADFVEADLSGTDLTNSQLQRSDFSGALLIDTNFENANLQDAIFVGANLTGANLVGANLNGVDFSGADLHGADLTGIDLTTAVLKGAQFTEAQLIGVNLSNATLTSIVLSSAHMNGANLANADLRGANLSRADLNGARLSGSKLNGAWLNTTSLIGADLTGSDLSGASLIGAQLASADFGESRLAGAALIGANFKGVNLKAVSLLGARIAKQELRASDLLLDPVLQEMNELQRSQVLVDADLSGASYDNRTIWPTTEYAEKVAMRDELASEVEVAASDSLKIGLLHSLSGPLAISEKAVLDAELLAIDEINANGGVLGKQLVPVIEDGASDPEIFAKKARKLLAEDKVEVIFGCWSSHSRKAVKAVVEELNGLLFYPLQYEGFESSPNIYYMGAEPSQQIIPAVDYLLGQGYEKILLLGSDYVFPHTANTIIKAQMTALSKTVAGEVYIPLGATDFSQIIAQLKVAAPDAIFNTLNGDSNVAFYQQFAEAGFTAAQLPIMNVSVAEAEIQAIGITNTVGHLTSWNYYQTLQTPENFAFVTAYKTAYGEERVTSDPIEAGYLAVQLWKSLAEKASSSKAAAIRAVTATGEVEFTAPEGVVRIDGKNQHLYKTVRIGKIREDGLIDEIFHSEAPIPPDPFLTQYPWAAGIKAELEAEQKKEKESAKP